MKRVETSALIESGIATVATSNRRHCRLSVGLNSVRGVMIGILLISASMVGSATSTATAAENSACVNSAVRAEQQAEYLPGCRAYELVSPAGVVPQLAEVTAAKNALSIEGARVAGGGESASFYSFYPAWGSIKPDGTYLAKRGPDGWQGEQVLPPLSPSARTGCRPTVLFSSELTAAVLSDGHAPLGQLPYCGHNEPSITEEPGPGFRAEPEMEEHQNIFLRESFEGVPSYRLVNQTPVTTQPGDAYLQAASRNLTHIVFGEDARLTPEAPAAGEALYLWDHGVVRLVSVLPSGQGVEGYIADPSGDTGSQLGRAKEAAEAGAAIYANAISSDGSRIFFKAEGDLFVRLNAEDPQSPLGAKGECTVAADACTVQIDESQASGGTGGGGIFLAATSDGAHVLFMDEASAKLTESTISGSGENLYEYEIASKRLTDLTAVRKANLLGFSGFGEASESGSYLYFVAEGALAGGAVEGKPNLYVVHDGEAPAFIAPLAAADSTTWSFGALSARVSPDGQFVVFTSTHTQQAANFPKGYNSEGQDEIYRYAAQTQTLACVSCRPDGTRPQAGGAAVLNPSRAVPVGAAPAYLQRYVLNDGTVFFQSREPLVAPATMGTSNVYEFSGDGELHLLSDPEAEGGSWFVDASESGNDVFIATNEALVKRDGDSALSVYDVRVDGGFAEPAEAKACEGQECSPTPTAPIFVPPTSVGFVGPGDATSAPPTASRHERLLSALKACKKKPARRRKSCEAAARRRFGSQTGHKVSRHKRLLSALKACKKQPARRRKSCEAAARRRFGSQTGRTNTHQAKGGHR